MSNTYDSKGNRVKVTAGTAGYSAGDVVVVRSGATGMVGVAVADIAASAVGEVEIEGVHVLTKATGTANVFATGDIAYYDVADGNFSKQASANIKAGIATEAAAAAATTVKIKLIPSKA